MGNFFKRCGREEDTQGDTRSKRPPPEETVVSFRLKLRTLYSTIRYEYMVILSCCCDSVCLQKFSRRVLTHLPGVLRICKSRLSLVLCLPTCEHAPLGVGYATLL